MSDCRPGRLDDLGRNVERVMERIARAAARSGRRPDEVALVAVTKGVAPETAARAVAAGVTRLGENRVQEAEAKKEALAAFQAEVEWHLIGHLQTNKATRAAGLFDLVHSVDRHRVVETLSEAVLHQGRPPLEILVQVNISGEESKFGVPPGEAAGLLRRIASLEGLRVRGLMTIAPIVDDPEKVRPLFRGLARLARDLDRLRLPRVSMDLLSMGMSQDYEVAVSEGANLVRVGTAVFGHRGG